MSVTKTSLNTTIVSGKRTTPFGAMENPELLLSLPDKVVLQVDTLACLKELWGDNILMARQHLYELVAGIVPDSDFQGLITSYYKRYSAFANYVDEKYLFGEKQQPLIVRIIEPARAAIRNYEQRVIAISQQYGGEFLGNHQDYVYVAFRNECIPEFEGGCRVC